MLRTKTYFFMHTYPVKYFTVREMSTQGSYLLNIQVFLNVTPYRLAYLTVWKSTWADFYQTPLLGPQISSAL
jgi:hypothetical protein